MATFSGISGNLGVGGNNEAIRRAISAFSDQEYSDAVRIAGTALVGSDARISVSEEDYFGMIRWTETLGDLNYGSQVTGRTNIGIGSEDRTQEGFVTDVSHDASQYIKTLRAMGARQSNVTQLLTGAPNAIEKVSRDFGVTRARDADAALLAMLRGVTSAEVGRRIDGAAALTTSTTAVGNRRGLHLTIDDSDRGSTGFFYDVNSPENNSAVSSNATAGSARLISSAVGGKAAENLWQAAAAGFADLEPDFFYLVVSPEVYQDIRTANLLDNQDRISDGNIQLDTLLQGKFRLIVTRSLTATGTDQNGFNFTGPSAAAAGDFVNKGSDKTSYLMLPGALYQHDLAVPNPVAFDADESVGRGTGEREVWYRWGNVYHPRGYTWTGLVNAWATQRAVASSNALGTQGSNYDEGINWQRKENSYNLGILPIFHS